jgi:hypothetical protein
MANEAVIIELFNGGRPMTFTCADGTGIEKGTLMELTSPRTVIANTNDNAPLVGVAAAEKVASDGATTIAVYTDGVFDVLTDTGTDAVGAMMANTATENTVQGADATDLLQGSVLGKVLETCTNGGTHAIRVNL